MILIELHVELSHIEDSKATISNWLTMVGVLSIAGADLFILLSGLRLGNSVRAESELESADVFSCER